MSSFLTHPRSLWSQIIALALLFGGLTIYAYIFTYQGTLTVTNDGMTFVLDHVNTTLALVGLLLLVFGILMTIAIFVRTWRYAKRHPKYTMRKLMIPEFRDDDEGMSAATAKAARAVYVYNSYAYALLILLFGLFIVPSNAFWVVLALSSSLLGMLVSYAWNMRHIELED